MYECWFWTRASEAIHVCDRTDAVEIYVDDVITLYDLYKCLCSVKPVVDRLIDLYLLYDMRMFISTHDAMTRRIQRLEKLLRIIGSISCEVREPRGDYDATVFVFLDKLLEPVISKIREIIVILKHFKGYFHRDRDKVHQFVYPVLRNLLDTLQRSWSVVLKTYHGGERIMLVAEIGTEPRESRIRLKISSERTYISRDLNEKAVMYIIKRGRNRSERVKMVEEIGMKIYRREHRRKRIVATQRFWVA